MLNKFILNQVIPFIDKYFISIILIQIIHGLMKTNDLSYELNSISRYQFHTLLLTIIGSLLLTLNIEILLKSFRYKCNLLAIICVPLSIFCLFFSDYLLR